MEAAPNSESGSSGTVNPLGVPDWDARLLRDFPTASFFHGAAWARVLTGTYGFTPVYFRLGPGDQPLAFLPMMEVDSWLTGRRGVSLPFTDECGPLGAGAGAFPENFTGAVAYGRARRWKYVECRGGRQLLPAAAPSAAYWGHRLDLQQTPDALSAGLDESTRRAVRKSAKSGLTFEFSRELTAVRAFHDLLGRTRRRHGVPVQPFKFFRNIHRHVLDSNQGWVVLARHRGVPVAGAVFFHFGRNVLYKFGASDERQQNLRANNLVMWEAINRYAAEGYASLDFGRTSLANEGLRRFKLGWGAAERKIEYVRYDLRQNRFVTSGAESSPWANRVFRTLPVFLSRLIGAMLYKHIA